MVLSLDLYRKGEDGEPINYFVDILPRMAKAYDSDVTMYEVIQEPGDTLFVPSR